MNKKEPSLSDHRLVPLTSNRGADGMKPMKIAELRKEIKKFEDKLKDETDPDDIAWTRKWINHFKKELAKKERNKKDKEKQRRKK